MSEHVHLFETPQSATAVALAFELEPLLQEWSQLRLAMTRNIPAEFSRDEWAYLITFLEHDHLLGVFEQSFGRFVATASVPVRTLARPRGLVAIWLPNNVSLLGPLTLILMSLTGNPIQLKGGTKSEGLTGAFLNFIIKHSGDGVLQSFFRERVQFGVFGRDDVRNAEMAAAAVQRIVFGSDASAEAIHRLPHPLESTGFSFADRRSEAWIEKEAMQDSVLSDLLKVFAIYGQAGCTSPRRVVLLGADRDEVLTLRNRLVDLWPQVIKRKPAIHVASSTLMASQWAASLGWDVRLAPNNAAMFVVGSCDSPDFTATTGLMCVGATLNEAVNSLPPNIQTIGHAFTRPSDPQWLRLIGSTRACRLVPIGRMHHFGPVWDGQAYWRRAFDEVEINC